MTAQQALARLATYCSKAEHCLQDIRKKLDLWQIDPEEQEEIVTYLLHEHYIDEARYCRAFINDKTGFAHWGENKIRYALRMKGIATAVIEQEWAEYGKAYSELSAIEELLEKKNRTLKAGNWPERKNKLIRFALGRGFSFDSVMRVVDRFKKADE